MTRGQSTLLPRPTADRCAMLCFNTVECKTSEERKHRDLHLGSRRPGLGTAVVDK